MCCFNTTTKEWVPPQVFFRDIPYAPGHGILIEQISFVNGI